MGSSAGIPWGWARTVESCGGSGRGTGLQGGCQHIRFDGHAGHAALISLRATQARQLSRFLQRGQELVQLLQFCSKLRKGKKKTTHKWVNQPKHSISPPCCFLPRISCGQRTSPASLCLARHKPQGGQGLSPPQSLVLSNSFEMLTLQISIIINGIYNPQLWKMGDNLLC